MEPIERLFGYEHAFDHPVTAVVSAILAVCVVSTWPVISLTTRLGLVDRQKHSEMIRRCLTWAVLTAIMLVPVLAGAAWTMVGMLILSIACYREFARATGMFRHRLISLMVVIGIVAITAAAADHWYGLFVAIPPLMIVVIAAAGLLADQPKGYIQRVALGALAFLLFGVSLGHLSFLANDVAYRSIIILIVMSVELNDIFAFLAGKTFGKRRLAPNTSPHKTVAGALGAMIGTTALVYVVGHYTFIDSVLDQPVHLIALGLIVSIGGIFGDLMLSSVKRDLGLKDMGVTLPGHGGLLDRFDSLLLVAPAVFHYISFFRGVGIGQAERILSSM